MLQNVHTESICRPFIVYVLYLFPLLLTIQQINHVWFVASLKKIQYDLNSQCGEPSQKAEK